MNRRIAFSLRVLVLAAFGLLLPGCEQLGIGAKQSNALGNRPDLDCIIANDFYAMHFSAYLQPNKEDLASGDKAAFVPFCQQIPRTGKMFFTADLIDRDIRETPIGIRLVEVEKTGRPAPDDVRELRTLVEIPAKLYPRGAVEAQADIDRNGDYLLFFLIGDAIEEDDKFKVPLQVGTGPGQIPWLMIASLTAAGLLILGLSIWLALRIKRRSATVEGGE